ncbi:MAG: hypothetical protein ACKO24_01065 [Leptolyngbyaceae cyanobacterium]
MSIFTPHCHDRAVPSDYCGFDRLVGDRSTVLACVGSDRPLQYTPAKVNQQGKIVGSLNPIRILLKPTRLAHINR